ncbi:MAG: glycosyltransferase family 2 protein [Patescibacteria group bacterium]
MPNNQATQPFVSVIMPVYNAAAYLPLAIESILKQSYTNWELIIVDDASTDGSWQIIQHYVRTSTGKITAYQLDKNHNAGGDTAANIAYQHASGQYVARMDADDISHPKRLQHQVKFLQQNPHVTILGTNAVVIDSSGKKMGNKTMPAEHNAITQEYFRYHPIINPTVMINRSLFPNKSQLYQLKNSSNNDYYTFFRLLCDGHQFANVQEPLLSYRIHGQNDSLANVKRSFKNTLLTRIEMVKKHGYRPSLKNWLITAAQLSIILILPEKVLFELYLHLRGIKKLKAPAFTSVTASYIASVRAELLRSSINWRHKIAKKVLYNTHS